MKPVFKVYLDGKFSHDMPSMPPPMLADEECRCQPGEPEGTSHVFRVYIRGEAFFDYSANPATISCHFRTKCAHPIVVTWQ